MKKLFLLIFLVVTLLSKQELVYAKQGDSIKHAIVISSKEISEKNAIKTNERAIKKNEILWFKFTTSSKGEYDITSYGNTDTIGVLYKKNFIGKPTKLGQNDNSGSNKNFMLKSSLKSSTTYYIGITARSKGKVKVGVQVHQDKCLDNTFPKIGGSWIPNNNAMQPYRNQTISKITWLTPGDAAIYSTGLAKSKYLRMLNTGIKLSVILTTAKISKSSNVGKFIMKIGEKDVTKIITTIAGSYGGIKLIPDIIDISQTSIEKHTKNYKYGLKVTTMISGSYGTVNCYDDWNLKKSSINAPAFCRGRFKKGDLKVGGW